MILIVRLVAKYALWIYVLCGVGMLLYLRAAFVARREGTQAIFSLERETAASRIYRSARMVILLLLIAIGVYGLSNHVELPETSASPIASPTPEPAATGTTIPRPSMSVSPTLTAAPTPTRRRRNDVVVLPTLAPVETSTASAPVTQAQCPHPNVQVSQPGLEQVINEGIEVRGTANKEAFDRYEFKFRSRDVPDEWHWVSSFTTPVVNGSLGYWSTSHLPAGRYSFLLIAIDRTGNSQECTVPVVIQH